MDALGGQLDLIDANLGKSLAMADEFADALLGLIFEDQNLFIFGLAKDRAGNRGTCNKRRPNGNGISAAAGQNDPIECNGRTDFQVDRVATNQVAFTHAELFAIRFDDCVHNCGRLPHVGPSVNVGEATLAVSFLRSGRFEGRSVFELEGQAFGGAASLVEVGEVGCEDAVACVVEASTEAGGCGM